MLFETEYPILVCECAALAGSRGGLVEVLHDGSSCIDLCMPLAEGM